MVGNQQQKTQRTRNPDNPIEAGGDDIGDIDHSVELGGIDHVSSETWDGNMARKL